MTRRGDATIAHRGIALSQPVHEDRLTLSGAMDLIDPIMHPHTCHFFNLPKRAKDLEHVPCL